MRQERTVQASLFDLFAAHEIGRELKAMSQWLDEHRELIELAAEDLRRHGADRARRPAGRVGPALCASQAASPTELRGAGVSSRRTRLRFGPSRGCRCPGRRRSRRCTGRSAPFVPRPGRRSIELCLPARVRRKSKPARSCGSTAPSPPLSCMTPATAVFSGMRSMCWCGCCRRLTP